LSDEIKKALPKSWQIIREIYLEEVSSKRRKAEDQVI
jgi:hypothetical protein